MCIRDRQLAAGLMSAVMVCLGDEEERSEPAEQLEVVAELVAPCMGWVLKQRYRQIPTEAVKLLGQMGFAPQFEWEHSSYMN